MMEIASFVMNEFQENTYIVFDETRECVVVDPGCFRPSEQQAIKQFVAENNLKPVALLNTHCHVDHVLGNTFVADTFRIPLYMHEKELFTYDDTARWTALFGIPPLERPEQTVFISEKDEIVFGKSTLRIAFTPGHSIGSVSFYNLEEQFALVGDVIFRESIGRTDLAGGNFETLMNSIQSQVMIWPDEMRLLSGHGYETTVGYERKFNPFLNP